jgi:hypothetical protein
MGKIQGLLNVKAGSIYSNHRVLKVQVVCTSVHIIGFPHAQFFKINFTPPLYYIPILKLDDFTPLQSE